MIKKVILLIGPPGSGKGTQGKILAEKLMLPHISTGDIFRKIATNNTDESRLLYEYMDSGKLVPSELVNKIVKTAILSDDYKNGCILDGYPRNLEQAEYGILIPVDNNQSPRLNNIQLSNSEKYIMEAMSLLLDNKDIRESYINRSEYRVINFEINQIIPQWEEILEDVLN